MSSKRGRPQTSDSTTAEVADRRDAWRRRQQNRRSRIAAQAGPSRPPPTRAQLQQGEQLVDLTLNEEEAAAITLTQLGLRVQGVTIAQDFTQVQDQEGATAVDEHDTLYERHEPPAKSSRASNDRVTPRNFFRQFARRKSPQPESSRQPKRSLSDFYRTLPARNPSLQPAPPQQSESNTVSHPFSECQRSASPIDFPPATAAYENDEVTDADIARATPAEEETWIPIDGSGELTNHVQGDGEQEEHEEQQGPEEVAEEHAGSSDQESVHNFASEQSAHGDESDEEVEPSPTEYMVDKLYEQLIVHFHGCRSGKHEEQLHEHMESAGDNHHGLNEVSNDPDFPSVLGLSEMITAERLAREHPPSATQWEAMFCGTDRRQRRPWNVCLHQEQTQAVPAQIAFDVDSFLGFGTSLAMAKKGIWCLPVPQMRQNLVADNHVETRAFHDSGDPDQPARSSMAMLRDVPHFMLGRVEGYHDITIHILFPHLTAGGEKFVSLTKEQHTRWLDRIFLPAVGEYFQAHYTQHLPGNFDHAYANSKAHQVEGRQVETASYGAQHSIGHHLQPEDLDHIWNEILTTIRDTPGMADFCEPQLFFSAKGTKLRFKTRPSRPTLLDAMRFFQATFEDVIDPAFLQLDRFYIDIGKEICPEVSLLASQVPQFGEEPQVYVRRRCCLEEYMRWMYDGQPPKSGRGQMYFHQNMLQDATSLTSVSPKSSKHRQGGLVYSQFYASVKEISDATKQFPFTNDGMEEMALDPHIRRGARQAAGGHRRDGKIIERAYLQSKRRTRDALRACRQKSYGVREEHRITWALFLALMNRLAVEEPESLMMTLADCPSYAWAIKSSVYADFLWRSADKFATGFEVTRARCRKELVTWEQTKIMAMFLRCLRFVFGGHLLSRESALWWSRKERRVGEPPRERIWYGLGFSNTIARYGYGWLEPRVDWGRLQFHSSITDNVLFGNNVLHGQYLRRGRQIQDFFEITRRMELALEWLQQYQDVETIRTRLILWVVHICLQQFRIDVMQFVEAEIGAQHREEALKGTTPFSFQWLQEIMTDGVYRVSGNRCDFKVVHHLGQYLFDFDDGLVRKHWDARLFRVLFHRASTAIAIHGRDLQRTFDHCFWTTLYRYHWIFPYPCSNCFMQTTKQGQRMWYSIQVREDVNPRTATMWQWGRAEKGWQEGSPRDLPEWVQWGKEEWVNWIRERAG